MDEVLIHTVAEDVRDRHQQKYAESGDQSRHGNVPHLLESSGSVHRCRFVELPVDTGDRCYVDDGALANYFPQSPCHHLEPGVAVSHQQVHALIPDAHVHHQTADESVGGEDTESDRVY